MTTRLEASKPVAIRLLAESDSQLSEFGRKLIPEGSRLKTLIPVRLFLSGDVSYGSDGSVTGFYHPSISVAYLARGPIRSLKPVDEPGGVGFRTGADLTPRGPEQLNIAHFSVEVTRDKSLGLLAVTYTERIEQEGDLVPHIRIEDPNEQLLIGQSFILLALANSLDPEGIA
jgi:hypothetical protein